MPKKKTKRSQVKYPSLEKHYNSRVRQEYLDYDYVNELSEEEKQFLEDFNKEYYNASVGKQVDEGKNNRFTKGKDAVKAAQDANNARNACLYGRAKAHGTMSKYDVKAVQEFIEDKRVPSTNNIEDALIDYLDYSQELSDSSSNGDE